MHLVQTVAFRGEEPWHGLGNKLAPNQTIDVWKRATGMDWRIEEAEVRFAAAGNRNLGSIHAFPEQKVLYHSDNKLSLSVVSTRYQVVQPEEILEFYRDLTEIGGFQLETAGVLKEGRKLWALATACDGTLATTAQFTSIRVVCNNTLQIALGNNAGAIKVSHRSQFDAALVKRQLGIAVSTWDAFMARTKALSERKMTDSAAEAFLRRVLTYSTANLPDRETVAVNERAIKAAGPVLRRSRQGCGSCVRVGYCMGIAEFGYGIRRSPPPRPLSPFQYVSYCRATSSGTYTSPAGPADIPQSVSTA